MIVPYLSKSNINLIVYLCIYLYRFINESYITLSYIGVSIDNLRCKGIKKKFSSIICYNYIYHLIYK